ncbi:hypothetical protein GCM10018779_30460 [Streptomyces griseocarneus]|nr:hypothetical protein GCM10018779_30460 [Streptomyces griseocarneus]
MLGALLDLSLVRIAEASADARRFDREAIRAAADVWDNTTLPLVRAATAGTHGARERRALAVLEWMAGFGEERRAWMVERASAAGLSLDGLLSPAKPDEPGRDYQGRVMAPVMAMTPRTVQSLAVDYDLPSAEVRYVRVERAGSRLTGYLELAVARAYPVDDDTSLGSATLNIRLCDITEVRFDSRDARGVTFRPEADGVAIGIGAHGMLHAATADLHPDDSYWHLSAAGHRADAATPPRESRPAYAGVPQEGQLGAYAMAAATLLHRAMLEIRMVRYAQSAPRVPVRVIHQVFAGAGQAILAAGGHSLPHRREAAFLRLMETWARRGGPALAKWFAAVLSETACPPDVLAGLTDRAARAHRTVDAPQRSAPAPSAAPGPLEAELRLAAYTSAHTRYGTHRDASALVHLAVPPYPDSAEEAPWRLRGVHSTEPTHVQLRTEAFQGTGRPHLTVDDDGAHHFALHDGALRITSGNGWNGWDGWNHNPS